MTSSFFTRFCSLLRNRTLCYTVFMKIYSLQEENDKLNAAGGLYQAGANRDMFDIKRPAARQRNIKTTVSKPSVRQGSTGRASARPFRQQKSTGPVPSQPVRQQMTAGTAPAQSARQQGTSQKQRTPQKQGRRGALIGWILFLLFLALINYLADIF